MARRLDKARMVRFHEPSGSLDATELGRTASHFYLSVGTIETFNEMNRAGKRGRHPAHARCAAEFSNIKVREEEMEELERPPRPGGRSLVQGRPRVDKAGKTNVLMQAFIGASPSRPSPSSPTAPSSRSRRRASRAASSRSRSRAAGSRSPRRSLRVAKSLERRAWPMRSPLRQIGGQPRTSTRSWRRASRAVETLREMAVGEIGALHQQPAGGARDQGGGGDAAAPHHRRRRSRSRGRCCA